MAETILVVDDEPSILAAMEMMLEEHYRVRTASSAAEALQACREEKPALVLLDIGLPDRNGLDVMEQFRQADPDAVIVIITAVEEVKTVVKAVKLGAYDYLVKPVDAQGVLLTIQNGLEQRRLKDQIRNIQQPNIERYRFDLIGMSASMRSTVETAEKVARSPGTPVLLVGESGTGKGVLARTIHYSNSNMPGPFVAVNCTAIAHDLFESELFGYERGAFTGAKNEGKKGRFEEAAAGTLFLDEIGSMSLAAQAKLLGVLEDRTFYRVGGTRPIQVSSRIIAATNSDLKTAVDEGHFRGDLYFRLNVVKIELPSLRGRSEDILPLAEHFLSLYSRNFAKKFSKISMEAKRMLLSYPWPGNVRELRNTIERVVLLEEGDTLLPDHLAFLQRERTNAGPLCMDSFGEELDYTRLLKGLIQEGLRRSQGNVLEAARLLKMPPHKIRYRMKKYGLRE